MHEFLPIDDVLPELIHAIKSRGMAVLQAPPGAGKTSRVPLALLKSGHVTGKIVMLEPRRLAARAAAERLAAQLGDAVGETVGYAMRGERKIGPNTRIEVVTEGILTRMIQSDPELPGVGAVIFDEFHERSLNADLGLALCIECRAALREDLALIVMSATLDAAPVAALLGDAPIITSKGRSFPVAHIFLPRPRAKGLRLENAMADLIETALNEQSGGILAFLPGEGEIRRTEALLVKRIGPNVALHPLFGAMKFQDQRAAIQPEVGGKRKIVLATSIAETSLTIEDVRVVVDGGLARRARFDPGTGMARLVTERASRAEAEQRAGRAGRLAPGTAYRLWAKGENGALPAYAPAEIETADLTDLALELALWGAPPEDLPFLTPPSPAALSEAQSLLNDLGALTKDGRITPHGNALARLPLHPRLGHMLTTAGPQAAELAALLNERDPLGRNAGADLSLRLRALKDRSLPKEVAARIGQEIKRLRKLTSNNGAAPLSLGAITALAYPDRIGQRRKGSAPRYVLSGGKGAAFEEDDSLSSAPYIVVTDTDGNPREARIRQAAQITLPDIRALYGDRIAWQNECVWSKRDRRVTTRSVEKLGALALDERIWKDAPEEDIAKAMLEGVRTLGLNLSAAERRFQTRVALLRQSGEDLPDMSEDALLENAEVWLLPYLSGIKTAEQFKTLSLLEPLKSRLTWEQTQRLDAAAPSHVETPLGRRIPVDYSHGTPEIELRLQEMFGTVKHPVVAGQALRVTLLSPAGRPVQTTTDIPAFWDTSYADVRKDMRGRYPKHPWPENPREADPTLRRKLRKS
ncbi:ATP-dependent helicase HrpB [Planktotalea arctica]|uniref:ATP-dependent helicase HrpB n=1 Tax=Planktotalea arctica TaxID=1481893 RepID=UPI00321BD9A8